MHVYNVSLQAASAITQAAVGNFSGSKTQEICVARNSSISLLLPDPNTGKVSTICSTQVFGIVRSLKSFKLTGSAKDYIVVSSDSGRIVILEFNVEKRVFEKVHQETFGKSGLRRIVPGQFLACDPSGRAVMIGAVENKKYVYVLNRDADMNLTISSPLESNKNLLLCYFMVGVDVGFDNPIFACIEVDCGESDVDSTSKAYQDIQKVLTYYELDLGLNHVVRKWSEPIDRSANHLVAIPGGKDGPSGVLVCSEGLITWRHAEYDSLRIPIPKRPSVQPADRNVIIISSVVHRLKKTFFVLVQTEEGDVFKVTMDYKHGPEKAIGQVSEIKIKYFETLSPGIELCLLKSGFLFLAAEFGNHTLYQIENLGDDEDNQLELSSNDFEQNGILDLSKVSAQFSPRVLRNLSPVDEMESFSPLIEAKVLNLTEEETPQIYALCGKGSRSTFRILRHGLEVNEIAVTELPGVPSAVWTIPGANRDSSDKFIVISFVNATLVLSVGENVEEVTDSGFLVTTPTIGVGKLGEDALVQVHAHGIRHIREDRRVSEWKTPVGVTNIKATCNNRQIAVALSNGEVVYFELDSGGNLNEFQEHKEMASNITCLAMSPITEGRKRAKYLAIGCSDNTVRILSLDPADCLETISMQALSAMPESLCLTEMIDSTSGITSLFVNIGLSNGVLLRTTIDSITGALTDTRLRFLGAKPVKLFPITVAGTSGLLALSSRPWIAYSFQSRYRLVPLSYEELEYGSNFKSEQCPEGMVAISGNSLRILSADKLSNVFNQVSVRLKYTPRRFLLDDASRNFVIIESECNTYCDSKMKEIMAASDDMQEESENNVMQNTEHFGLPYAPPGNWGSCVRLLSPFSGDTLDLLELDANEAAVSMSKGMFIPYPNETLMVVGSGKGMHLVPKSQISGFVSVYRVASEGSKLELLQKTEIEGVPYATCAFQGKLLVGMGQTLRLYELGKKKLLRKCETKVFPFNIVKIETQGDRIIVSDAKESVLFCQYRHYDNQIVIFADDFVSRWMTCSMMLDYDTVVGGDKFGNIFINRLAAETSLSMDDDTTGSLALYERGYLNGAPYKLLHMVDFHIGEPISSIQRVSLVPGGREVILYTTFFGAIGILVPFTNKEDIDFFQLLEMSMRQEAPPLCGQNHLTFRSTYTPVTHCIDGDFCEMYNTLPNEKKRAMAEQLDRSTSEVAKKLEDIRNRVAF